MSGSSYRFGRFELHAVERKLFADCQPVALRPRAFDLLRSLVEAQGALVTKDALLDRVWPGLVVEESNVQVQVSGLRRLLGAEAIATVPGLGYRLAFPVLPLLPPGRVLRRKTDIGTADAEPADAAALLQLPAADGLLGREHDIVELLDWLQRDRLVTVLGAGGTGKTRVAQEVARRCAGDGGQAVVWVDLAAVADSGSLSSVIAAACGVDLPQESDADPLPALQSRLRHSAALLVLDNCEHLSQAVASLAAAVLQAAPRLRLLTTSQERLQLAGERVYRLQPLAVPPPGTPWDQALDYSAVQLLLQRARAADQHFALGSDSAPAAVELVRRLDGLPLAIEMAAARAPHLGLAALSGQLADWVRLLRSPLRDGPQRHSTLRAALDWSHSLLDQRERTVLRRLAPFAGPFTVACAATAVACDDISVWDAVDALAALADKSLLQAVPGEPPRYRLLETTRLLAQEQLAEHGEARSAELAHGRALAALAEAMVDDHWRSTDRACRVRYAADQADLQLAFDRACERKDIEVAALTGAALVRLDYLRNLHAGRRRRAEALHGLLPGASPKALAWAWHCIASMGLIALKAVSRHEASRQAVLAWRAVDDPRLLHFSLCYHAVMCARIGAYDDAAGALAEAQTLERNDWPPRPHWFRASSIAAVARHRGDTAAFRAASLVELELAERAGTDQAVAWVRLKLANGARVDGDFEEAITLGHSAVATMREQNQQANLGLALTHLATACLMCGRIEAVPALAAEALPLMCDNDWGYLIQDMLALLAALQQQPETAARLLGCADGWYSAHGETRVVEETETVVARVIDIVGATLGAERLEALRAEGAAMGEAQSRGLCQTLLTPARAPR